MNDESKCIKCPECKFWEREEPEIKEEPLYSPGYGYCKNIQALYFDSLDQICIGFDFGHKITKDVRHPFLSYKTFGCIHGKKK